MAKTVDGVTTGYVLDPAAGLTQVLVESTGGQQTAYLYGHDLLAQYDSGTWAYHVNDGLGSVRQLADPTGQVVQSYSFSPYGVPLGESGGEPYGFTGEQWDASAGLVLLRARYLDVNTGRFLTMDSWPGDMRRPSTLNRGIYVTNNPINLSDPSGHVPTPKKIKSGDHSFSCNCGWIDWGHASPATARRIIRQVKEKEDFQLISPEHILIAVREPSEPPFYMPYVEAEAIVRRGLSEPEQDSVALGIFMEISERYEESWSQRAADSDYTLEDLPSDLIGFYVARQTERDKTGEITGLQLKELVTPKYDVIDDVKWTLDVYDDYERAGLLEKKNRNWCRAWLVWSCTIAEKCTMHPQWPSAYNQIAPEHSRLEGQWWWAEDDPRIMSWGRRLVDAKLEVWATYPLPHPIPGLP